MTLSMPPFRSFIIVKVEKLVGYSIFCYLSLSITTVFHSSTIEPLVFSLFSRFEFAREGPL